MMTYSICVGEDVVDFYVELIMDSVGMAPLIMVKPRAMVVVAAFAALLPQVAAEPGGALVPYQLTNSGSDDFPWFCVTMMMIMFGMGLCSGIGSPASSASSWGWLR